MDIPAIGRPIVRAAVLCLACGPVSLGWTSVGPGIEYQEFQLPDPNNLFVARMDRDNPQCFVDTTLGGGKLGTSEIIRYQASRVDDAINYWDQDWGQRNDVVVAVNGDFLDTSTNTPLMGQIMTGWYVKPITSGARRFYYAPDHNLAIGFGSPVFRNLLFPASGQSLPISGVNRVRGTDELILYTPQYDSNTKTDNTGVEVLVEMTRPAMVLPSSDPAMGTVRQIRQNAGSTTIPFDHVVLSATGTMASSLLAKAQLGESVGLAIYLEGYPISFTKTYASIGGGETFLGNGQVWGGQDIRHPRTAIAYNDQYLYFVVVDGRSTVSVGMTMTELGNFCKDYLDATWGINQDGGGSSTMIVNGVVKNDPSDGHERAVVNGIFMGVLQPKQQSVAFSSGDTVRTTSNNTSVRLGPGSNYAQLTAVGRNVEGTILDHHLRGIYAKADHWWKCDFGGTAGWVSEGGLSLVSTGSLPRFTQHPAVLGLCPGGTGSFTVAATAAGALSYRWQKNGSDLSDGGTISGAATPSLTISGAAPGHVGSYRCRVTDSTGSTISYSAPLRVLLDTIILDQPEDRTDPLVKRGTDVTFTVKARGDGALVYRWQKDGQDLTDSTEYSGTATSVLTVRAVDTADEGTFRCIVTGACGTLYSQQAGLAVLSTDFDRDGDVDQGDFGHLQACFSGPTIPQTDPACRDANLDDDPEQDVDQNDLNVLLQCLGGADIPRPSGC